MEIITANELISGATVYFLGDGKWGANIDRARIFSTSESDLRNRVIGRAQELGRLLSIEFEPVNVENGRVRPTRLRERIRAEGPTAPRFQPQKPDLPEF